MIEFIGVFNIWLILIYNGLITWYDKEWDLLKHLDIKYKIKAFPYPPHRFIWITTITNIEIENSKHKWFIYHQSIGPYKYWKHTVQLKENENNAVELIDEYEYIMPDGLIGELAHECIVKSLLDEITTHRKEKLDK